MKKLIVGIVVLAVLILWWIFSTDNQPVPEVKNSTIVWVGDSIGAGYGASEGNSPPDYLARQLGLPVINESTSGDTTADGVAKMPVVQAHEPGLVIIQLAGNDALRKLSPTETEANLRQMIETFLADGSAVMVVGIRTGMFSKEYDDLFEMLADEYNVLYLPDALKGLFGRTEYMADPIHPNDAGSAILAERVFDAIFPIYEL